MMPEPLHSYFESRRKLVEKALDHYMDKTISEPEIIHEAMRYSVFAGGKRLRPVLVLAAAECCGKKPEIALPTAAAMELIHTYSLVHDDLPAMDDDDLRRGRPTNHKVYGEAIAILAGDALLTKAFELISENAKIHSVRAQAVPAVVHLIAHGAGTFGMVGGQVLDIQMDGGQWKKHNGLPRTQASVEQLLRSIHRLKTAALIRSSLQAGALLAGASPKQLSAFGDYGEKIGLAFQIADDVLDVVADKKKLGKSGSDAKNKKLTFPAIYGLEASRRKAQTLVEEAKAALKPFKRQAQILKQLANYIVERDH
ncbi:MAG: polyprenyl synthetase family protein [Elusimicrobiota bacterium]|jgi:geranylgeranyl diphosphate synthase type II